MTSRRIGSALLASYLVGCGGAAPMPTAAPLVQADPGSPQVAAVSVEPAPPPPAPEPEATVEPPVVVEPDRSVWDPDAPIVLPAEVIANVRAIARRVPARNDAVFAKIGDSATASRTFMRCFADDDELELAGREELRPTLERIRAARVAGRTSFSRESEAALVGRSVHTLLRGNPSPVVREVQALSPRFALVMFGGNDIEIGRLDLFATSMLELVDLLVARGVVPILSTISARDDDAESDAQVPRYIAVIEAVARARRVPLIDVHRALASLPGHGLASDGVHPNSPIVNGRAHACDFSEAGMQHGMNVRNLLNLRMLAYLGEILGNDDAGEVPERAPVTRVGPGRFAHVATTVGAPSAVDGYPGCEAVQSEAGPERRFALDVDAEGPLRAEVMYDGSVDVDVHLLRDGVCVARGDRWLEARVTPGAYEVVVDTFESDSHAGEFLLLVER